MKAIIRILILLLFLVIALGGFMFIRYNQDPAGLWLGITFQSRAAGQWYLLFFIAGSLVGLLSGLGLYRHLRNRLQVRQLEKRVRILTEENARLRAAQSPEKPQAAI